MIKQTLADYVAATARTFEGDRSQTVGASDVGQCSRKTFWSKMEGDPVYGALRDVDYVDGWGARVRGTIFENHFWLPALRARFGDKLLYAGADQRTLVSGFLSATPDGLLVDQPRNALAAFGIRHIGKAGEIVVECKTIDPRARLDAAKLEHTFQTQVQLGLLRELTPHRPRFALISYSNASFWDDVTEYVVEFDPKIYATAKRRADQIMLARRPEELRPEGWIAGGHECEYCPFTRACGRARTDLPGKSVAQADPGFIAAIATLARRAKRIEAAADAKTAKLRGLQHTIRERLRLKGLRHVAGDGVLVTWSPVRGRPAFDMPGIRAAAAKAGIDLAQFETVGAGTDRLVIQIQEFVKLRTKHPRSRETSRPRAIPPARLIRKR